MAKFWDLIKFQFYKFLRGKFIRLALKELLGSVTAGGVQGWLIKNGLGYVYDRWAIPFMQRMVRGGLFKYDTRKGRIVFKKFTKAKLEHDEDTYNDIVDNA